MNVNASELMKRYEAGERDFQASNFIAASLSKVNLSGASLQAASLSEADREHPLLEDIQVLGE
jgi:uncharacterized protein YjbI with pentapeptide repeats